MAHAQTLSSTCGEGGDPTAWSDCVTTTDGSESEDVLYVFHGLGGTDQTWTTLGFNRKLRERWAQTNRPAPTVVAISFGRDGFVSEEGEVASAYFEALVEEALPQIETDVFGTLTGGRLLLGFSMGGFNATQLLLERPHWFERAALVCPALFEFEPYGTPAQIRRAKNEYRQRTGAGRFFVTRAADLIREYFPTREDMQRAAVLTLAPSHLSPDTPPLLLSANRSDWFGFFPDTERFRDIARERGVDVEWMARPGGHCLFHDASRIADFLAGD